MKAIVGVLLHLVLCCGVAEAQGMKVLPLAPSSALLTEDRQAATVEKFGQVSVSEISLASKIGITDAAIAGVKQHAEHFDFYLVPIKFGVLGFDGKTCRWLQFGATLKAPGAGANQVFIVNVFPATSLKRGTVEANTKITISGEMKFETPETSPAKGNLSVGGSTELTWKWSPLYQQAVAVFDQSRVVWRFEAVAPEFPVGEIDVAAIVAVAKSKGNKVKIGFDVEMRASFGGGWFDPAGVARVDTGIVVRLP